MNSAINEAHKKHVHIFHDVGFCIFHVSTYVNSQYVVIIDSIQFLNFVILCYNYI